MDPDDTIAAIATAPGEGSVAIIRLSGPEALSIADTVFRSKGPPPSQRASHTVMFGCIVDQAGETIDRVLLLQMRAPKSYTRENVVEIQGHGGGTTPRRILRACLDEGARLAEPGEFTRRAFLAGRIDLLQAEAVLDLVRARSERARAAALEQLAGGLSESFDDLYDSLLLTTGQIEATLDFPEDELPDTVIPELTEKLAGLLKRMSALIAGWEEGHLLRDGALVVISGKPNVGKSTLLNALLNRERAIVTDIPGTTRDAIEEQLVLNGIPVRLVDTAGLRDAQDQVEKIGIERTRQLVREADFHLLLFDLTQPLDLESLTDRDPKRTLVIFNKTDLNPVLEHVDALKGFEVVKTCLLHDKGVDVLQEKLANCLSTQAHLNARPQAVISERHRRLLVDAQSDLEQALAGLNSGREDLLEPAASLCRSALETLGEATGRIYHEELLDHIFGRFCIGK